MSSTLNCPYCRNIFRVRATPSTKASSVFDQVLSIGPKVVLTPTLGMFVAGYFLIVSQEHINGFSSFTPVSLEELEFYTTKVIRLLSPIFGKYLVFEHGAPRKIKNESYGGCIDHAHFHLIPVNQKTLYEITNALPWKLLNSLSELSGRENSYALFNPEGCAYYFVEEPKLHSQWIRRVVAQSIGVDSLWDWGAYRGEKELDVTLSALKAIRSKLECLN